MNAIFAEFILFIFLNFGIIFTLEVVENSCPPELVSVTNNGLLSGCYPKVPIEQPCEYNQQCQAKVLNSYCGLSGSTRICLCKDGYLYSDGQFACLPVRTCSQTRGEVDDFNPVLTPSNHCEKRQFCREGLCLCLPEFEFDLSGNCVRLGEKTRCAQGEVWIVDQDQGLDPGCYPKIDLLEAECTFSDQCVMPNSACWHNPLKQSEDEQEAKTCQCLEEYIQSKDSRHCLTFNESLSEISAQIADDKMTSTSWILIILTTLFILLIGIAGIYYAYKYFQIKNATNLNQMNKSEESHEMQDSEVTPAGEPLLSKENAELSSQNALDKKNILETDSNANEIQ